MLTALYLAVVALCVACLASAMYLQERRARKRVLGTVKALHEKASTFQIVAENAGDGLVLQKMDSTIIWANHAYGKITGYPVPELLGRRPADFVIPMEAIPDPSASTAFHYDDHPELFDGFMLRLNLRKDGEEFYNQHKLSKVHVEWEGTLEEAVVVSCRDVTDYVTQDTELRQAFSALVKLARFDGLTGLANRAWFNELLEKALREASASGGSIALCQVDLDRFKEVNDTFGHAAGDAVLCHIANALRDHQSERMVAGRLGGDEFCFFVTDPADLEELADQARLLQRDFAAPLDWEKGKIVPSGTIGIAISTPDETDIDGLFKRSDFALYAAKTKSRGNVGVFDSALRDTYERHRRIREDLASTIDRGALVYNFQPIVSIDPSSPVIFETLVRWNHPEYGPIAPDVFLPLAREMGRLPEVDFFAARSALRLLADLEKDGRTNVAAGVNVSAETLADSMFLDFVLWEAERCGIEHTRLHLEILETVFFSSDGQNDESSKAINRFKSEGFPVHLDDFGVGHAGLSHLASLNVDGIKIDRSLVAPLPDDPQSLVIVESIVQLAEKLNLSVVAEGLETQAHIACLRDMGCAMFQGFGLARPMRGDDVVSWLQKYPNPAILTSSRRSRAG